jgi:MFS family permease
MGPAHELDDTLPPDLKLQLTIFGFLRFSETTAWTSVFPYAYFLMRDMPERPPLERVPFLASLVIAVYTLSEFVGNIPWAYLSDRVGRRPVLLFGITVNVVFMVWFGFARSVASVIALRALQGMLNPSTGLIGGCVAEAIGRRKHLQGEWGEGEEYM